MINFLSREGSWSTIDLDDFGAVEAADTSSAARSRQRAGGKASGRGAAGRPIRSALTLLQHENVAMMGKMTRCIRVSVSLRSLEVLGVLGRSDEEHWIHFMFAPLSRLLSTVEVLTVEGCRAAVEGVEGVEGVEAIASTPTEHGVRKRCVEGVEASVEVCRGVSRCVEAGAQKISKAKATQPTFLPNT